MENSTYVLLSSLELFSCLPLWKKLKLPGKKLENAKTLLTIKIYEPYLQILTKLFDCLSLILSQILIKGYDRFRSTAIYLLRNPFESLVSTKGGLISNIFFYFGSNLQKFVPNHDPEPFLSI